MTCNECMLFNENGIDDNQGNWNLKVTMPDMNSGKSAEFNYTLTKLSDVGLSNIVICLCEGAEGDALAEKIILDQSGYKIPGDPTLMGTVQITLNGESPGEGAALPCVPQVRFEDLPDEEDEVILILVFEEPVDIGAVEIGYKTQADLTGQWDDDGIPIVCGPCCNGSRGLIIDI